MFISICTEKYLHNSNPFMIKNFRQTRNKTELPESHKVAQKSYKNYQNIMGKYLKLFPRKGEQNIDANFYSTMSLPHSILLYDLAKALRKKKKASYNNLKERKKLSLFTNDIYC